MSPVEWDLLTRTVYASLMTVRESKDWEHFAEQVADALRRNELVTSLETVAPPKPPARQYCPKCLTVVLRS